MRAERKVCQDCEYSNPIQAVKEALPGDTILVAAGSYKCPGLEITKPLVLIGELQELSMPEKFEIYLAEITMLILLTTMVLPKVK